MRKNSSILIIVLFVLMITSIFGVMITRHVWSMIEHTSKFHDYYNAYYLAYWWLQLQLLKVDNRWFGFEDEIPTTSDTVKDNINCSWCNFYWKIYAKSNVLLDDSNISNYPNQCAGSENDYFDLQPWEGIIVPLFKDESNNLEWLVYNQNKNSLSDYVDIDLEFEENSDYVLGLVDDQWNHISEKNSSMSNLSVHPNLNQLDEKRYMVLVNIDDADNLKFCIDSTNFALPTKYVNVISSWKYHDTKVGLSTTKDVSLPDYLIQNFLED